VSFVASWFNLTLYTNDDNRVYIVSEPPPDRKPSVIHTRVPEELDAEIKRRANSLGVSVSNLVRNVLQHTFGLVGDIVADSASIARSARGGAAPPAPPAAPVLAWQRAVLNLNAVCSTCNAILKKGSRAAVSVPAGNAVLCLACLEELEHDHA
jgi:hypothetical protein